MMRPRKWLNLAPEPPSAGKQKLADPHLVRRRWLLVTGALLIAGAALWPVGLGAGFDHMRRDIVTAGYLRAAQTAAQARPVQRERALACLRRALRVAPDPDRFAGEAANLFLVLRAYPEAYQWFSRIPVSAGLTRISQAQCLFMMGQPRRAEELLAQAVIEVVRLRGTGGMPDELYSLTLNNAGYVLALAGRDLTEARAYVNRALEVSPLLPAYLDSLGWVAYRQGQLQEAAFYLERAVRQNGGPEDPEMLYHLGACYARQGRVQAARQVLRRCLALDPSLGEARRLLDGLRQVLPPPAFAESTDKRAVAGA